MPKIQVRRMTDAARLAVTPAIGEPIWTTDTKKLYLGDGVTVGGIAVASSGSIMGLAPLVSPALTGTPTAPTATDGTNTTQLATTAFVQNAVGGYLAKTMTSADVTLTDAEASNPIIKVSGTLTANVNLILPVTAKRIYAVWNATSGAFTLTVKTPAGAGVTVAQGKRNLVYTDGTTVQDAFNDFESIALTGTPTAPTAAAGTNTTQLATTAFVQAAKPTIENVLTSTSTTNALSAAQGKALNDAKAPLVSPALTGTPTAPTAAAGTNTTQLATTAFVQAALNAEFASLKASSGYTKLPNDLILQWGTFSTPAAANTDVTVTFPIAFPNACLSAGCTSEADQALGIAAFTKTNVTVSKGASDHYARFGYWYSIGH